MRLLSVLGQASGLNPWGEPREGNAAWCELDRPRCIEDERVMEMLPQPSFPTVVPPKPPRVKIDKVAAWRAAMGIRLVPRHRNAVQAVKRVEFIKNETTVL